MPTLLEVHATEVEVEHVEARAELERVPELDDRFVVAARVVEHVAERAVHQPGKRVELVRLASLHDGLVEAA